MSVRRLPDAALLDTSVLLRLFHDHNDGLQPAATALRAAFVDNGIDLILLDLSVYEFVNILVRRLGRRSKDAAGDVDALFGLGAPVYAVDQELAREAATVAAETGLSGYDAAFVAASALLGVPLITADQEIIRSNSGYGIIALADLS